MISIYGLNAGRRYEELEMGRERGKDREEKNGFRLRVRLRVLFGIRFQTSCLYVAHFGSIV